MGHVQYTEAELMNALNSVTVSLLTKELSWKLTELCPDKNVLDKMIDKYWQVSGVNNAPNYDQLKVEFVEMIVEDAVSIMKEHGFSDIQARAFMTVYRSVIVPE